MKAWGKNFMKQSIFLISLLIVSPLINAKVIPLNDSMDLDTRSIEILKNPKRVVYRISSYSEDVDIEHIYSINATVNCTNQTFYYLSLSKYDLYGKFIKNLDISKYPSKANPSDIGKYSVQKYIYDHYCK